MKPLKQRLFDNETVLLTFKQEKVIDCSNLNKCLMPKNRTVVASPNQYRKTVQKQET